MNKGYTYAVNFYKKVDGLGWMFHSFHTTDDAVKLHFRSLMKQQVAGTVRNFEVIKLKWRQKGVNAFFDPALRKEICSAGGKVQGKINAESGHLKNISVQYWADVKSGKVSRPKKIWYHSDLEKRSILVKDGDTVPDGYVIGRKIKW